jgi:phytoene synthase
MADLSETHRLVAGATVPTASNDLAAAASDAQPDVDAMDALRELMRGGSRTFFAASLLLPPRVRGGATVLYAWCRLADDAIDLSPDPLTQTQGLRERLDAIYAGQPGSDPADRALAQLVRQHALPRILLDGLLEGFLWDAEGRRYETLDDVHDYGARVAGTVGALMARLMGARDPATLARACELGVAMQLTNIARDVGEDARNGRLYLPRRWLAELGLDVQAWLRDPHPHAAVAQCTERLLAEADRLYARAEHGVAALPLDCRPAILAARRVYAEIGQQLRRNGLDNMHQRAVVSGRRKLALIAQSTARAWMSPTSALGDPSALPAVQFLVDAAARPGASRLASNAGRSFDERMARAAELYERLIERDHTAILRRH